MKYIHVRQHINSKKKKKHNRSKNRGGKCRSWKRSTSPPHSHSTYSDVVLIGPLGEIIYHSYMCERMS